MNIYETCQKNDHLWLFWINMAVILTMSGGTSVKFPIMILPKVFHFHLHASGLINSFLWDMTVRRWVSGFRYFEGNAVVRNVGNRLPIYVMSCLTRIHSYSTALWNLKTYTLHHFGTCIYQGNAIQKLEDVRSGDSDGHIPFSVLYFKSITLHVPAFIETNMLRQTETRQDQFLVRVFSVIA